MLQTLRTRPIDETKPTMVMGLKDGTLNFGLLLLLVLFLSEQGFVQPRRLLFGTSNGTIMCSEPPLVLP
jgi:hypothetical protein